MASNLTGLPLLHQAHAERLAGIGALLGARFAVSEIVRTALEYALIELSAGIAPEDVRLLGSIGIETSPSIAQHGLTEFALDEFERGFEARLAAIASTREGRQ